MSIFQFTPLREGRHTARGWGKKRWKFQFTPLREGRRRWRDGNVSARRISIHAPPRGATALARRQRISETYFNSRPSARGDKQLFHFRLRVFISIHAPPRGATPIL